MIFGFPPLLGSIEATRPVFLIVMGTSLMVTAWRLNKTSPGWPGKIIIAGALLLGLGYVVVMPSYETGLVERYSPMRPFRGSSSTALAWHTVKLASLNSGWLLFGLGVALHAKLFSLAPASRSPHPSPKLGARELTA